MCDIVNGALSPAVWTSAYLSRITGVCIVSVAHPCYIDFVGLVLVLYVLAWNTTNVKLPPTLPTSLQPYANVLMLDQVRTNTGAFLEFG